MSNIDLGISRAQLASMQRAVDNLERANDAIGNTQIRHAVNQRLVEVRLFLRDGHLRNMSVGAGPGPGRTVTT